MISTRGLRKRYRRVAALDGLNLNVPGGAIYGLIGQNGAGKTTTIRVLATLMQPDDGEATVDGVDVLRRPAEARRVLGYVPDFFGVYDDLTVDEYLEFYAALEGIYRPAIVGLRDNLLDLVDLGGKRDEYVDRLSRGMQQRLCLARALIHDPKVLLLDEPASGLDPIARVELREILKELRGLGKTVLISSHILAELADLCSHVGMMAGGRMVREGTVGEIVHAANRERYRLAVIGDAADAARILEELPNVTDVTISKDEVSFTAVGASEAAVALAKVVGQGILVSRYGPVEESLEQTFVALAREQSLAIRNGR